MKTSPDNHCTKDDASGRPLLALFLLFVVPILTGALVAPPAFRLLEWLSQYVNLGRHFTDPPFRRVLSRCVMLVALALLYPAVRLSGFRRWNELGWAPVPEGRRRSIGNWFAAGAVSMGIAYLLSNIAGALYFQPRSTDLVALATRWTSRFAGAMLIGLLEETFFRGYLHGVLRCRMRLTGAVLTGGFLFSIVHFARPVEPVGLDPRYWAAGFQMLPHIADGIQAQYAAPMFVNLFLMGVLLCLLYEHFGNLYAVIGLHAGWVWMQEVCLTLFARNGTRLWLLFGRSRTISMTAAGTIMLILFLAAALMLRHRERSS